MDLGAVLGQAFAGGATGLPEDATATRILDAAVATCAAHGIGELTIDGVARRAGVNRVTVYRRFGDRDALLHAMTLREGERMARGILEAIEGLEDPVEQLVEGFAAALRRLQDAGRATHLDPDAVGETMARLFASFVLLPAQHAIDVRTQAGARDYSRRTLVPLLLG